jgi:hypothetical protein
MSLYLQQVAKTLLLSATFVLVYCTQSHFKCSGGGTVQENSILISRKRNKKYLEIIEKKIKFKNFKNN